MQLGQLSSSIAITSLFLLYIPVLNPSYKTKISKDCLYQDLDTDPMKAQDFTPSGGNLGLPNR
jgi:hypothetical protein